MPIAMTHIDLQKLINIDHLVHIRRTGTPAEFARKVGLSRSTLFPDFVNASPKNRPQIMVRFACAAP